VAIIKREGDTTPAPVTEFGQYLDDRVIAVTDADGRRLFRRAD
jgi:hypothetical protein